jgi:hypothetical protein
MKRLDLRGESIGVSLGLLERPVWAALFNYHGDVGQRAENYFITAFTFPYI